MKGENLRRLTMTIDTDKYEGPRTEGPWKYIREADTKDGDYRIYIVAPPYGTNNRLNGQGRIAMMLGEHTYYDAQLMVDAPLLLEEVKRLRKQVLALLDENQRLEAMYHMDVHGDDTLAKLLERKK